MGIIKDTATFLVVTERGEAWIDEQPAMRTMQEALDYIHDYAGISADTFQVIEFNPVEGYCRDVTEDAYRTMTEESKPNYASAYGMFFRNGLIVWEEIEEPRYSDPDAVEASMHRFRALR